MKFLAITSILMMMIVSNSIAQLEVGDDVPQFSAKDDTNKLWNSNDYGSSTCIFQYRENVQR